MRLPAAEMAYTVVITPLTGQGAYGEVYGSPVTVNGAFIEPSNRRIVDKRGNDVLSNLSAIFGPTVAVNPGDRMTFEGLLYEAVQVSSLRQGGKVQHVEAYFRSVGAAT